MGRDDIGDGGPVGTAGRALTALFLSQFWMGLSASAYVYMNAGLLGRRLPAGVYWLAAWGTWVVYALDARGEHSVEDRINRPRRTAFFESHSRALAAALLVALVPAPWMVREIDWTASAELLLGLLGLIGMAYVLALLPTRGGWRTLKRTGAYKSLIVTLAWAVGGIGVPLVLGRPTGQGPAGSLAGLAAWGTLVLFLDTLLLDHRDRVGDERSGVRTSATVLRQWTIPVLHWGTVAAGVLWLMLIPYNDPRWPVLGVAWATWLVPVLFHQRLQGREIGFSASISAWRFAGAAALWLVELRQGA